MILSAGAACFSDLHHFMRCTHVILCLACELALFDCCHASFLCECADMDPIPELEAQPEDVAEACLLPFKMSKNAMPIELTISTCKDYKK